MEYKGIPNPHWLAGFTDADGCFFISVYNSPKSKLGKAVQLLFIITQHSRDKVLMKSLLDYFDCGDYYLRKNKEACDFKVISIKDINEKVIPFFSKYKLQGIKSLNFSDFYLAAKIMETKAHLTFEGLNEILKIKTRMNKGRPNDN